MNTSSKKVARGDRSSVAPEPRSGIPHVRTLTMGAILVVVTCAAFAPALKGQFVWDDGQWLWKNSFTTDPAGIFRCWWTRETSDYWPLTSSAFWIQYRIFGDKPAGYHAVNIFLHAINAVLLWWVLRKLKIPAAWLGAMLFAVHPLGVASVAWITELKNTLSMLFYLLSIGLYLKFDEDRRRGFDDAQRRGSDKVDRRGGWGGYIAAAAAFGLGLAAKSSIVILPIVLLGCLWWRYNRIALRDLLRIIPFFMLSAVFSALTLWYQAARLTVDVNGPANVLERLVLIGKSFWFYVGKSLWPAELMMVYPAFDLDGSNIAGYLPLAAMISMVAVLFFYRNRLARPLTFGVGYFLIALGPVLGLFSMSYWYHSYVSDHLAYVALPGMTAMVAGLMGGALKTAPKQLKRAAAAAGCLLVGLLALLSYQRSAVFRDPMTLWTDTTSKNPAAFVGWNNMGNWLLDRGQAHQAIEYLNNAIAAKGDYALAYNNRGRGYSELGQYDLALPDLNEAIRLDPELSPSYNNRANIHRDQGKYDLAMADYAKSIELQPKSSKAYNNRGMTYTRMGRYGEAIADYNSALRLNPRSIKALSNRGNSWMLMGQYDKAIADYNRAIRLHPGFAAAYNNRGLVWHRAARLGKALEDFTRAIDIQGNYPKAFNNRAEIHRLMGNLQAAMKDCKTSIQQNPRSGLPYHQLAMIQVALGKPVEARESFLKSLQLTRTYEAADGLAWLLATYPRDDIRNGADALRLAELASARATTFKSEYLRTKAAAYAELARFPDAVAAADSAITLATAQGKRDLAAQIETERQFYLASKPFRTGQRGETP